MRERTDPDTVASLQPGTWRFLVRFWPAILFASYLTFTVVVFAFGPIDYPVPNRGATYGFLVITHLALVGGYCAVPFRVRGARPAPSFAWILSAPTLVVISSILNIVLLVPSTLFMTSGSFDVISALREPAVAHHRAYQASMTTTNPYVYAMMLVAPLMFLAIPLTLFYWRKLSLWQRGLAIGAIAVIWASGVMLGRNKNFADLFLMILLFVLVHQFRRSQPLKPRRWVPGLLGVLTIFLLFFAMFSARTAGSNRRFTEGYVPSTGGQLDYASVFLKPFPESARPGVGQLYNYLTQGYYGLSLALRLDFVWTYGLGNSFFLHMVEERFVGSEYARANAYPARIEHEFGYSMTQRWHTIYPWLASDLTFAGTIIFVFLIGMLLAITWFETLAGHNPFAVAMLANLSLMLFYFNANNQVLAFPVQFSATIGTLALWLITRAWFMQPCSGSNSAATSRELTPSST